MNIRKVVFSTPLLLIKRFFKSNADNFVGGLIFGAVFSLVVNIATVKVQEDISKQRALEALEREIAYHYITANNINQNYKDVQDKIKNSKEKIYVITTMNATYDTRIWDSTEVSKYMLEVDPKVGPLVEMYYTIYVKAANESNKENLESFNKYYESCKPLYNLLTGKQELSVQECNQLALLGSGAQVGITDLIYAGQKEIITKFHPTKNRLNSPWLRLLLGDKSIEVLK